MSNKITNVLILKKGKEKDNDKSKRIKNKLIEKKEEKLKKRMSNVKKVFAKTIVLIEILFCVLPTISHANVVNLGETKYLERGDLGFYTIQYWNQAKSRWMYITYSRTYYTDDNGEKRIAYCTSPNLDGIGYLPGEAEGYNTTIKEKLSDIKMWRVFKNGYPYVSKEILGVETDDDAYLATKQAAYCIIRKQTLEEVKAYYRGGEDPINNQNLEDIKRRGDKVVNAIYNLVNKAYNGTDTMNKSNITPIGNLKQDDNNNYYSQEYKISDEKNDSEITINSIQSMYNAFSTDKDGNKRTSFKGGEIFKIMIPKDKIIADETIQINYTNKCLNYPVYYAKSSIENTQDYLLMVEKYDDEVNNISLNVEGNKSILTIKKVDEESKKPLLGISFTVKYDTGEEIGNFTTNENGEIKLENLHQGKIILNENITNENYEIDTTEKEINIEYNSSQIIEIENKHKKGSLEILKVDKDNNEQKINEAEFDLLDNSGNIVNHLVTDENGHAILENINTGEYILRETKAPEGYILSEDKNIEISYNTTLKLKVEDEYKKGQIKIIKRDADNNNIKLENVGFEILDINKNIVEKLKTDKNGEATTSKLRIGTYYVKEIETNKEYILDNAEKEVQIEEDTVYELNVDNYKKKGQIKIIKTSENKNNITHVDAGLPINNVQFNIYDQKGNIVDTITTDKDGVAISKKLELGSYKIKEINAGEWYLLNEKEYVIELKENEEIQELKITNKSKDPEVEVNKKGPEVAQISDEIEYKLNLKNSGNTNLENFTWYDFLPYEYGKITKFETGTFNQELKYNIFYKTNTSKKYILLKENLDTKENNYLDFSNIILSDDEKVTEVKFEFGEVDIGFENKEQSKLYFKINENLTNKDKFINETIVEGYHNNYKVCDDDKVETAIVIPDKEIKLLPRTGF